MTKHTIITGGTRGIGFGLAAASLAGQALGRGDPEDAKQWGWDVTKIAIRVVAALSLPAVMPLPIFEVRIVDGEVQVRVED